MLIVEFPCKTLSKRKAELKSSFEQLIKCSTYS